MTDEARPRPRSHGYRMLAASMVGLAEVFDPPKDERPGIEQAAPGQPADDPIDLQLDPDHPECSVVVLRLVPPST